MGWHRIDDDTLDNPKVQQLSLELFKAWHNLLCVANRFDRCNGRLPKLEHIAYMLRAPADVVFSYVSALVGAGLIDRVNATTWAMHDWKDYQFSSDTSTERVKRFRQRSKQRSSNGEGNVAETPYLPTNLQTKDLTNFETQETYRATGISPEKPNYRSPPKSKSDNKLEHLPDKPQKSPRADIEAIKQQGRKQRELSDKEQIQPATSEP